MEDSKFLKTALIYNHVIFCFCLDQSSAEFPTLLHFACKFGLSKLVEVILHYPGAYEACSLKNYQGHRPYSIAEDNGYDQLANELRAFHVSS